ncbi:hypothetical protein, partial [Akkermansia sp.]|uniref:hypothetical protein n=1 Tax=Akkermansia sp. TaxID=1872421 RepID=UPI003AB3A127
MLPVDEMFQLPTEWPVFQFHLAFQAVPLSVKIGMLWHIFDNIIMGETMHAAWEYIHANRPAKSPGVLENPPQPNKFYPISTQ